MPPASASTPLQDALPFLWLGGFAVCLTLHIAFSPLAPVFRRAIQWLGRHPAPLLWLTITLFLTRLWEYHFQSPPVPTPVLAQSAALDPALLSARSLAPWPYLLLEGLGQGLQHFALLFHQVIALPNFWPTHWAGAALQAAVAAFTQIWLGCYIINSRNIFTEEGLSLRQTFVRWPNVLLLALCYFPWWWIQGPAQTAPNWEIPRQWLLPEYFIFLAPLPLALATLRGSFVQAGELTLQGWRARGGLLAAFALTALPLLAVLHYCLGILPDLILGQWPIAKFFLESTLLATVHLWLFISAALLLLWGGYVDDAPVSPEEEA